MKKFIFAVVLLLLTKTLPSQHLGPTLNSVMPEVVSLMSYINPDGTLDTSNNNAFISEIDNSFYKKDNAEEVKLLIKQLGTYNPPICEVLFGMDEANNIKRRIFKELTESYKGKDLTSRGLTNLIPSVLSELVIEKASFTFKGILYKMLFDKLKEFDEYQILFPETFEVLEKIHKYKITLSPKILNESFKRDLASLPLNFPLIFELEKYAEYIEKNPLLAIYVQTNKIYRDIKNFKGITQEFYPLIDVLESSKYENNELLNSLKLFVHSVSQMADTKAIETENRLSPIDSAYISKIENNIIFRKVFLGCIIAQKPPIKFLIPFDSTNVPKTLSDSVINRPNSLVDNPTTKSFSSIIAHLQAVKKEKSYIKYLLKIYDYLQTNERIVNEISDYTYYNEPIPPSLKDDYVKNNIDLIKHGMNIRNIYPKIVIDTKESELFVTLLKRNLDLEQRIKQKEYFSTIMTLINMYGDICRCDSNYVPFYNSFGKSLFYTAGIIADITAADSDAEIASIMNKYMFSSMDAEAKKNSDWTLNINSYLGYYRGKQADNVTNSWTQNRGITAPIGVEFSRGFGNWGNLSLFIPLLDVGAVVDFKLNNDSTETITNLDLNNIFSPGVYLAYGVPKLPISLGIGFQISPIASKITLENGTIAEPRKPRWNAFISFDMPLLRILNF